MILINLYLEWKHWKLIFEQFWFENNFKKFDDWVNLRIFFNLSTSTVLRASLQFIRHSSNWPKLHISQSFEYLFLCSFVIFYLCQAVGISNWTIMHRQTITSRWFTVIIPHWAELTSTDPVCTHYDTEWRRSHWVGVYCNGSHRRGCTVMGCGRKHNGLMGKVSLNTEHRTHGAQKGKSSFLDFYRENVYQILSGFHLLCGIK